MARTYDAPTTRRAIESMDREIEDLVASVSRLARLGHARLPGTVALRRTYRAERLISVLQKQRAALEAGDRGRVEELDRELVALRSLAESVRPRLED
jgi:hypothetical protein